MRQRAMTRKEKKNWKTKKKEQEKMLKKTKPLLDKLKAHLKMLISNVALTMKSSVTPKR